MSFEFCNVPATFERMMEVILSDLQVRNIDNIEPRHEKTCLRGFATR